MSSNDGLAVKSNELAEAWNRTLPTVLNAGDKAEVKADEADAHALRVHIETEGRSMYSFDFHVRYVDSREIAVELSDVEQDGRHIDERGDIVQHLIEDYVRHMHECAQQLQGLTHANA